jgi:hypothetical protein
MFGLWRKLSVVRRNKISSATYNGLSKKHSTPLKYLLVKNVKVFWQIPLQMVFLEQLCSMGLELAMSNNNTQDRKLRACHIPNFSDMILNKPAFTYYAWSTCISSWFRSGIPVIIQSETLLSNEVLKAFARNVFLFHLYELVIFIFFLNNRRKSPK